MSNILTDEQLLEFINKVEKEMTNVENKVNNIMCKISNADFLSTEQVVKISKIIEDELNKTYEEAEKTAFNFQKNNPKLKKFWTSEGVRSNE